MAARDMETTRQLLGSVSMPFLYQQIRAGHLKTFKIGRRRFCDDKDIEAYIEARKAEPESFMKVPHRYINRETG